MLLGFMYGNQIRPEMIPYRLVPSDPHPDYLLEIEIELIHPYTVETMEEVHRQETLDIIYERIEFGRYERRYTMVNGMICLKHN